jgi:flagellar basal-body rod protein FlgB
MATSDVPLFSMLRTRMRWHQDRQKLLAENVANADTPGYRARDLAAPNVRRNTGLVATPDGNRVNLEDEMLKVAQNQLDYQAVAGLYQRSLGLIRTAIGKKG